MKSLFKNAVLLVALAGTTIAGGCMMDRDHDRDMDRHMSDRSSMDYSVVRFGYSDGYWDNGHQWHAWNSDADMRGYRDDHGAAYHDWHHDRDGGDGWEHN
ncbi:MAG: hypothetical protein WDM91_23445 [Rhizomicrobium sp.]